MDKRSLTTILAFFTAAILAIVITIAQMGGLQTLQWSHFLDYLLLWTRMFGLILVITFVIPTVINGIANYFRKDKKPISLWLIWIFLIICVGFTVLAILGSSQHPTGG